MADCPTCKFPGAYLGFTVVECLNPACKHFMEPPEASEELPDYDPRKCYCSAMGNMAPCSYCESGEYKA